MPADDVFDAFLDKLKKDKTPEEAAEFVANLMKFQAAELYLTMLSQLTDEDLDAVEKIPDDKEAEEEIKKRFQMRVGMSPLEFANKLRDKVASGYLFPELTKKSP